ncbi:MULTISPECIES: hypothetical protein [Parafrankia]
MGPFTAFGDPRGWVEAEIVEVWLGAGKSAGASCFQDQSMPPR